MITISTYKVTPYLAEGNRLPNPDINNGTEWLREAINAIYNRNKERLREAGVQTNLFHNHDEQKTDPITRYPLIQYQKRAGGYFAMGINDGSRALTELFIDPKPGMPINDWLQIAVKKVEDTAYETALHGNKITYTLTNWLPFNSENYKRYRQMSAVSEKINFLEQMLLAHLLKDFVHFLKLEIDPALVQLSITDIDSFTRPCVQMRVNKHIHDFQPFTVSFSTNLLLPPHICLGNGKVFGFGLTEPAPQPA